MEKKQHEAQFGSFIFEVFSIQDLLSDKVLTNWSNTIFFLILVYIIFISVNEIKVSLLEVVNLLSE